MVYLQLLLRRPLVSPLAVVARPWCHNPLVDIVRAASLVTALGLNGNILLATCPLSRRIDFSTYRSAPRRHGVTITL